MSSPRKNSIEAVSMSHHSEVPASSTPAATYSDDEIVANLAQAGDTVGVTWRTVLAAGTMASSYNAYVFTLLIPPAILSLINTELGPSPSYTWITISWNLGGAMLVTVGGRLSDIFGRRWFFIVGASFLVLGSIIGATGKSIPQMIACGAVYGFGSGFLEMAYGAVQEIVPNKYRMITVGIFDVAAVIAQTSPLWAWAVIATTGNWRICYYVMIGVHVLTVIYLFFCYNPPSFETKYAGRGINRLQLLKHFDWIGLGMFVSGCTLFLIGVNWGGTMFPWTSAATLCPIIIGICLLIALGFHEAYANIKEPLLPPRLFKNFRGFVCPIVVVSIVGMQYYSSASLFPRLSQTIYSTGLISNGLYACVIPLGSILGGIFIIFSDYIKHQRWQIVVAICIQTACIGGLSTITLTSYQQAIGLTFTVSFCVTVIMMNAFVLIGFGIANQEDIGTALGLAGTSRLLAGAIAIAIFSNITNNKLAQEIVGRVAARVGPLGFSGSIDAVAAAARSGAAALNAIPGMTPAIRDAALLGNKEAYLDGARLAYLVALAFGVVGCIFALFIPSIDERKLNSRTVALQEEDRKDLEKKRTLQKTEA